MAALVGVDRGRVGRTVRHVGAVGAASPGIVAATLVRCRCSQSTTSSSAADRRNQSGWRSRSSASGSWCRQSGLAGPSSAERSPARPCSSPCNSPRRSYHVLVAGSSPARPLGPDGVRPPRLRDRAPRIARLDRRQRLAAGHARAGHRLQPDLSRQQPAVPGLRAGLGGRGRPVHAAARRRRTGAPPCLPPGRGHEAGDRGDRMVGDRVGPRRAPGPLLRPLPDGARAAPRHPGRSEPRRCDRGGPCDAVPRRSRRWCWSRCSRRRRSSASP